MDSRPGSIYHPLQPSQKQIRLLELQNHRGSEIHCKLVTVSLLSGQIPKYAALSYTWGDASDTTAIYVNGTRYQASSNLVDFLKTHVKRPERRRLPLWVDALCIQQGDEAEKSTQVAMMADIYRSATITYAWLGADADTISPVMRYLQQLSDTVQKDQQRWRKLLPGAVDRILSRLSQFTKTSKFDDIQFIELFFHHYFHRMWVFQELVLSSYVLLTCGESKIPLETIFELKQKSTDERYKARPPRGVDRKHWATIFYLLQTSDLMNLLSQTRDLLQADGKMSLTNVQQVFDIYSKTKKLQATVPVDKIFGVLGVLRFPIVPDYKKSARDVYIDFASYAIEIGRLNDVLQSAGSCKANNIDHTLTLPSWVPHWRKDSYIQPCLKGVPIASNSVTKVASLKAASLFLRGWQICTVKIATRALGRDIFGAIQEIYDNMNTTYVTRAPRLRALLETLSMSEEANAIEYVPFLWNIIIFGENSDRTVDQNLQNLGFEHRNATTFLDIFIDKMGGPEKTRSSPYDLCLDVAAAAVRQPSGFAATKSMQQYDHASQSALLVLENDFIGMTESGVVQGDLVCEIEGCDRYCILRPKGKAFTYVASCYVKDMQQYVSLDQPIATFEVI